MNDYLLYRRQLKLEGKPPSEKKVYKIKPFSDKRAALNREYAKKSRPYWKGKECEIKAPGCDKIARGIHHMKGKHSAELLMDERWWIAACNKCNLWVEVNDAEARSKGFKLSRL